MNRIKNPKCCFLDTDFVCSERASLEDGIEKVCLEPCNISKAADKKSEAIDLKQVKTEVRSINNFFSNKILEH